MSDAKQLAELILQQGTATRGRRRALLVVEHERTVPRNRVSAIDLAMRIRQSGYGEWTTSRTEQAAMILVKEGALVRKEGGFAISDPARLKAVL